jgi:hypothetical protein
MPMGSLSRRAERRTEEREAHSARELRSQLRLLAGACRVMIQTRGAGGDLEEAIEQHMGWGRFIRAVSDSETAAGPEDTRAELLLHYPTIRQFAPALLNAFQFRGGGTATGLLRAIEMLRGLYRADQRTCPHRCQPGSFVVSGGRWCYAMEQWIAPIKSAFCGSFATGCALEISGWRTRMTTGPSRTRSCPIGFWKISRRKGCCLSMSDPRMGAGACPC